MLKRNENAIQDILGRLAAELTTSVGCNASKEDEEHMAY